MLCLVLEEGDVSIQTPQKSSKTVFASPGSPQVLASCFGGEGGGGEGSGAFAGAPGAAARAARPAAPTPTRDSDTVLIAWLIFCCFVIGGYLLYGERFARYVVANYLIDDDYSLLEEEDDVHGFYEEGGDYLGASVHDEM